MTDPIVTTQTPNLYGPAQSFGLTNRYDYKGLDPELALAERAADQRQLIANAILNQSSVPRRGKMVGRLYQKAHWAEGLGQLGEAAAGALMINNIQNKRAEAERDSTQRVTDAITKFNSATQDEPAGTITHAAQPAQPGNFEAVMSQQPSPSEVTPLRSVDDFSRQTPAPALTGQYQRATPNVLYEMGSPAQPERTEVSPGLPVDERSRQAAMAQLAMSPHPQVKEFYQNQLALAKEARTQQQMDARDAEHTRQFGVTSGISQQMQDLAQRKERDDQARYAREDYDKNRQNEAALFEKSVEARARIESDAANRLSNEAIARGHDAAQRSIARGHDAARAERPLPGMMVGPDGEHIPVIGSKQWNEESKSIRLDSDTLKTSYEQSSNVNKKISEMLDPDNVSAFNSVFGRATWFTQKIGSMTDPKTNDMKNNLDSLLSMASVMGLSDIKKMSGGSAGTITEREWPRLESLMTALKETSSEHGARNALKDIKDYLAFGSHQKYEDYMTRHTDTRHKDLSVPTFNEYERKKEEFASTKKEASNAPIIMMARDANGKLVPR